MKLNTIMSVFTTSALSLFSSTETGSASETTSNQFQRTQKGECMSIPAQAQQADQANIIEIVPGLTYERTQDGAGEKPAQGSTVAVHYAGRLQDGTEFDNSYKRGEPIKFHLGSGQVIKGWDLGIAEMRVGEKGVLTIAPEHGYGERGAGDVIPGNATLVFEVELVAAD